MDTVECSGVDSSVNLNTATATGHGCEPHHRREPRSAQIQRTTAPEDGA